MLTTRKPHGANSIWTLAPSFGICLFILLYLLAAFLYPGGSDADKHEKGFNVLTNYWCDLLGQQAKNGDHNTARPVAMIAMFILCVSVFLFWFHVPKLFSANKYNQHIIRFSGMISMIIPLFLSTAYHDTVINVSGFFGVVALFVTIIGLYKIQSYKLFALGLFCILLVIVNNYVYHTGHFMAYLPVIQKITFFLFLLWFCLIDIAIYRKMKPAIV